MAIRSSLSDLLRRLRVLIGDPDSVTWTDDQVLQDSLDDNRLDNRYVELRAEETRTPGRVQYLDFYARAAVTMDGWEADVVLTDASWNVATPTTSDLQTGHWTFDVQPRWPITATGKTFDLYGAAADLLEKEAATQRRKFDVGEAGGASAKRSQPFDHMLTLAESYRAKQRPRTAVAVRSDTKPGRR